MAAISVFAAIVASAVPAGAHPLGNFTTNRYARIEIGSSVVRIRYVLDEAELVAFRSREGLARDPAAVRDSRVAQIGRDLRLVIGGAPVTLRPVKARLTEPPGQGGLSTLRIDAVFEGRLPDREAGDIVEGTFVDGNQPDRIGWREIVLVGVAGTRVRSSSVPAEDRSDALRDYPQDPGQGPSDVRRARFSFVAGSGQDGPASLDLDGPADGPSEGPPDGGRFVRLVVETSSSPLAVLAALGVAFGFGAVHALGPGHGKTVMAAYLVTTQGRRRDAVALGGIVSLMHTVSVLLLAAMLATVGRGIRADRLYPAMTLVAGVVVTAVGATLLRRRLRARREAARRAAHVPSVGGRDRDHPGHDHDHVSHDHDHASHDHDHDDHGHHHGPGGHTHELPTGASPLSRAGLVALGASGGLFPSPSAVVVLVGAFALGRAGLGLAMVAAFSVGLAAVLVGVGLLLVTGRDRLVGSRFGVSLPWLPVAGAGAITLLGLILVVQGVAGLR